MPLAQKSKNMSTVYFSSRGAIELAKRYDETSQRRDEILRQLPNRRYVCKLGSFQLVEILLDTGVIDSQELVGASHYVDIVVLAL